MLLNFFLTSDDIHRKFCQDTTTVKITLALGAGDFSSIRPIASLGVVGGLAAGTLGALLMTLLAFWPQVRDSGSPRAERVEMLVRPGLLYFMNSWPMNGHRFIDALLLLLQIYGLGPIEPSIRKHPHAHVSLVVNDARPAPCCDRSSKFF